MDILIAIAAGGLVLLCLAGIVGAIVILPIRRSSKSKEVATHWHYDLRRKLLVKLVTAMIQSHNHLFS